MQLCSSVGVMTGSRFVAIVLVSGKSIPGFVRLSETGLSFSWVGSVTLFFHENSQSAVFMST